jgi:hypothetical protein
VPASPKIEPPLSVAVTVTSQPTLNLRAILRSSTTPSDIHLSLRCNEPSKPVASLTNIAHGVSARYAFFRPPVFDSNLVFCVSISLMRDKLGIAKVFLDA